MNLFKAVYEELYNSAGTVDAMRNIKATVASLIGQQSMVEVNKLSGPTVKEAFARMRPGKADVTQGFTSDVLLHCTNILE